MRLERLLELRPPPQGAVGSNPRNGGLEWRPQRETGKSSPPGLLDRSALINDYYRHEGGVSGRDQALSTGEWSIRERYPSGKVLSVALPRVAGVA